MKVLCLLRLNILILIILPLLTHAGSKMLIKCPTGPQLKENIHFYKFTPSSLSSVSDAAAYGHLTIRKAKFIVSIFPNKIIMKEAAVRVNIKRFLRFVHLKYGMAAPPPQWAYILHSDGKLHKDEVCTYYGSLEKSGPLIVAALPIYETVASLL